MMDGNVKGLLYVSQPIIKLMKEKQNGQIINISSVAARQTYANGVVYCASKKAVDVISEGMRLELTEFGIRVTNIQPGAVETDFSKVRFKGDDDRAATVYTGYEPCCRKILQTRLLIASMLRKSFYCRDCNLSKSTG